MDVFAPVDMDSLSGATPEVASPQTPEPNKPPKFENDDNVGDCQIFTGLPNDIIE